MPYPSFGAILTEDIVAAKQAGTYTPVATVAPTAPSTSVAVALPTYNPMADTTSSVPDWLKRIVQYQQGTLQPYQYQPQQPPANGGGPIISKPLPYIDGGGGAIQPPSIIPPVQPEPGTQPPIAVDAVTGKEIPLTASESAALREQGVERIVTETMIPATEEEKAAAAAAAPPLPKWAVPVGIGLLLFLFAGK